MPGLGQLHKGTHLGHLKGAPTSTPKAAKLAHIFGAMFLCFSPPYAWLLGVIHNARLLVEAAFVLEVGDSRAFQDNFVLSGPATG